MPNSQVQVAGQGLCSSRAALTQTNGAYLSRDLFYSRSHDTLHDILPSLQSRDPSLRTRFEDTMVSLELTYGYLFQGTDPGPGLDALIAAFSQALVRIGYPAPTPC